MASEPVLGAHLVSQRHVARQPVYTHHGIYIGDGNVIHYAGKSDDPDADGKKIQVVSLERFSLEGQYWVVDHKRSAFSAEQRIVRARTRLGEDGYSVFANNCEHYCNWVVDDDHLSQQVNVGALIASAAGGGVGAVVGGVILPVGAAAASGLAGGAAMMQGLAVVGTVTGGVIGGLATVGVGIGAAAAHLTNKTLLKHIENADGTQIKSEHVEAENDSRRVGRAATFTGAAGAAAGTVAAVSAAGTVSGLSAAGITSGLAAIGSTVGGGMATGIALGVAAPAVAAVGVGYGAYKLAQKNETVRDGLNKAGYIVGDATSKGAEVAGRAIEVITPVAQDAAAAVATVAKHGLKSMLGAIGSGATALAKKLDGGEKT